MDTGLKRDTIDKFYTKESVAELCLLHYIKQIQTKDTDLIIEPSAGGGAFINSIKKHFKNTIFLDIQPEHKDIVKQDYLKFIPPITQNKIIVIGNPPFGRQSSLAIKFIKKSCEFCDVFAFILPISFKKESLKRHIPLEFHLIYELELDPDSFTVNNEDYSVKCIFQIWKKEDIKRNKPDLLKPKGFLFVKKEQQPDISFRRVGVYAGHINTNYEEKSIQSHYFIKFNKQIDKETMDKLNNIQFKTENTVGPKSISRQEIIYEFNKIF